MQGNPGRMMADLRPTHAAFMAALATQLRGVDAQLVSVEQQAVRKDQLGNLMHLLDALQVRTCGVGIHVSAVKIPAGIYAQEAGLYTLHGGGRIGRFRSPVTCAGCHAAAASP